MIELHGGRLAMESATGVGTTMTLRFPPERVLAPVARAEDAPPRW